MIRMFSSLNNNKKYNNMTHLFETLLTNSFGIDLYLKNDRISLTNETPHLVR